MLYNTSFTTAQPLKSAVNFGNTTRRITDDEETQKDQLKAERLKEMARKTEEANINTYGKIPTVIRSLTVVGLLSGASALTAAAVSGRFCNFLNGSFKPFSAVSGKLHKSLGTLSAKVKTSKLLGQQSFKGQVLKYTDKTLDFLQTISKRGVETELKELAKDKKAFVAKIRREIKKINKDNPLSKADFEKAVKEKLKVSKEYLNFEKAEHQIQGSSLLKRGVKIGTGAVAGTGTLKEATVDRNNDGIPDIVQHKDSGKTVTRRVTEAILDTALDC
ncbi:MAG: hypothetical protein KHX03_00235 [Clostridium sp.]|nr:hypothetical protein [Clostridium sp.]